MTGSVHLLARAEALALAQGDIDWFREHYTLLREYHGVEFSARAALAAQGLELEPRDKY